MIKMIPPAELISSKTHPLPGQLLVTELSFSVPLDYRSPDGPKIQLFGRSVTKNERPIVRPSAEEYAKDLAKKPWIAYLEGGPGFGCPTASNSAVAKFVLGRGYRLLLLDYRGTGLSTPVTADLLEYKGDAQQQAEYLKLFRQDSIVLDLEAVRQTLTADAPEDYRRWSLIGQSFGGFVCLTYLSKHPQGLREVFMTGGLAPVGRTAEEVYSSLYPRVAQRNQAFFDKFPEDAARLAKIAAFLAQRGGAVPLPSGGSLTLPRLLTMGLQFGAHGGFDAVHSTLLRLTTDLAQVGYITRPALTQLEQAGGFDNAVIYAILHEAIYCSGKGIASRWAAQRVGEKLDRFSWMKLDPAAAATAVADGKGSDPPFFSGEMILPLLFDTYPELSRIRAAADILAEFDGWGELYDEDQLARNEVPVYAASYIDDLYVDYEFAKETARKVKGTKTFETNAMAHNALRAKTDELLPQLFRLRDDVYD